jgi:hypothetical protein
MLPQSPVKKNQYIARVVVNGCNQIKKADGRAAGDRACGGNGAAL